MNKLFIPLFCFVTLFLSGCGTLNKALLSPPVAVVETTPAGQTVTNYVQYPSAGVTNAVTIGNTIAPLLPFPAGQGLTAILGIAAGAIGLYGRLQGIKVAEKNAQLSDLQDKHEETNSLLDTVIKGVESAPVAGLNAKAAISAEAKKAGVAGPLYERVQSVVKGDS